MTSQNAIPPKQAATMRVVLFWIFVSLYVILFIGTFAVVFLGLGHPLPGEREWLFKLFIIEAGCAVVALFYSLFGLRRTVAPSEAERLRDDVANKLDAYMHEVDFKVEHATAGILMVQADLEALQGKKADAAISYIHAVTHAALSRDNSLLHEVLKLLDEKLLVLEKKDWLESGELRNDVSMLIERLPELCKEEDVAYALRGINEFKAKMER